MEQPQDPYFKKVVEWRLREKTLRFRVSQALFSSHEVDDGTRLLVRSILDEIAPDGGALLDLGCGYGPVGIALRAAGAVDTAHMVDRDALAVDYARQNVSLNELDGVETYGSLGYDDLGSRRFDLIAMNVPGKAGERVIRHLLLGAAAHLRPGGQVLAVAVAPLAPFVSQVLAGEPAVQITHQILDAGYLVVHYRFRENLPEVTPGNAFAAGVYARDRARAVAGGHTIELETVYGLPEFDTPSFATQLLMQEIVTLVSSSAERCVAFNPGQGYVPALLATVARPSRMTLIDRDLLALRASCATLTGQGFDFASIDTLHRAKFDVLATPCALIVGVLREEEGTAACLAHVRGAANGLTPEGVLLVAGTSTMAVRVAKTLGAERALTVSELRRRKGHAVLRVTRR